jgi:CheY-like chemotaxis protein
MGLHVLLVDDSAGNRRVGGRMLQQLGCKCVLATDGDEVRARALQLQLLHLSPFVT